MKYEDLPVYEGKEIYCHECGKRFLMGAIIGVTDDNKTYCFIGGCYIGSAFEKSTVKNFGKPMRFGDINRRKSEPLQLNMLFAVRVNSIFIEMMEKLYGQKEKEDGK